VPELKQDEQQLNNQEQNPTPEGEQKEQVVTLTPSMLDSEGDDRKEIKPDLSKIIPTQGVAGSTTDALVLTSKDKELKSDGSVVIGIIRSEDEMIATAEGTIPEQIDVAKRKEEIQKNKHKKEKKKEPKRKIKTKEQKAQNRFALLGFLVAVIVAGAGLYIWKKPTVLDFQALPIEVELGDKLPTSVSTYVKPGIGETLNEMAYTIDTSEVKFDQIGEYTYTVKYQGQIKSGTIKVVDTTKPNLTLRDNVSIVEGTEYTPETFVLECVDYTGCNYSFEDSQTTSKYKKPGTYVVHIAARDAYDNKEVKQANLTIEATGMVRKYKKSLGYDAEKGYSIDYYYELHFTEEFNSSIIINGSYQEVYTYQDETKFKEAKNEYYGEINYTINDELKTITYKTEANTVGYNYSEMSLVHNYLIGDGYSEV
jgi:hypothetical protein